MRIILGINANHADSSACIILNDKIVAAIEEERLNRVKHFSGYPVKAIQECLNITNIKSDEITDIAFNTKPSSNLIAKSLFALKNISLKKNQSIKRIIKKMSIKKFLYKNFELNKAVKFHFIEHHLAHIASAFYPSGFKKSNGLSIDGSGDFITCAIAECEKKIMIKKKIFFPHSLGIFYHSMTQFLGFKNYGEEYKMMGLAPYGKPKYYQKIIDNLFNSENDNLFKLNLDFFNHWKPNYKYITGETLDIDQIFNNKLNELFFEEKLDNKNEFIKDFACSVQKVYENYFNQIIYYLFLKNYSKNIVFSGGCALNSSANLILTENKKYFQDVFINYAPGDNGGAIGAALVVAHKYFDKIDNLKTPYLGSEYNDHEIKETLENNTYKKKFIYRYYQNDDEFFKSVAKLISEGNVIGWFQGKMEFGPRALGNRSILADPSNPEMKNIINSKIKKRESFRPFAPVVLRKLQNEWFESNFNNLYMSSVQK